MGRMLNFERDLLPKRVSVTTATPGSEGRDILVADLEDAIVPWRLPIADARCFFSGVACTRPCPSPM